MTTTLPAPQRAAPPNNGTSVVFEDLYSELAQAIYNFVLRSVRDAELAQDICQEVWTNAYRGLPSIRESAAARGWLYRVARHAIIDAARRRRTAPVTVALEIEPLSWMSDPADVAAHTERLALAWQALGVLPTRQHMALYLKEVEGRRYCEIADVLECTESAVETLLCRARRAFATAFEGLAHDRSERCAQARRVMTVWLDGEGTPLLRRALNAHINECRECREIASVSERHARARAAIPLVPFAGAPWVGVTASTTGSAAAADAGLHAAVAKLIAGFTVKATSLALSAAAGVAITGSVAIGAALPAQQAGGSSVAPEPVDLPVIVRAGQSSVGPPAAIQQQAPSPTVPERGDGSDASSASAPTEEPGPGENPGAGTGDTAGPVLTPVLTALPTVLPANLAEDLTAAPTALAELLAATIPALGPTIGQVGSVIGDLELPPVILPEIVNVPLPPVILSEVISDALPPETLADSASESVPPIDLPEVVVAAVPPVLEPPTVDLPLPLPDLPLFP